MSLLVSVTVMSEGIRIRYVFTPLEMTGYIWDVVLHNEKEGSVDSAM